ncbi:MULTISPECIES: hypothetical protein [Capnocytophaga]|uniref:hypothetical protein n=1 Tax=Capnocytophaga TaxID=1016 RepID=UPI000589756F|nr:MULTISPECIES: hypothetical protein [Capnocytophaga]CEN44310.1 conserved hypothetical protein [Capnocytophaga canimorsus]VEJ18460.1 Uncharacterised protein [Capnocytophaga canimorsus]
MSKAIIDTPDRFLELATVLRNYQIDFCAFMFNTEDEIQQYIRKIEDRVRGLENYIKAMGYRISAIESQMSGQEPEAYQRMQNEIYRLREAMSRSYDFKVSLNNLCDEIKTVRNVGLTDVGDAIFRGRFGTMGTYRTEEALQKIFDKQNKIGFIGLEQMALFLKEYLAMEIPAIVSADE